jgi:hypothetical protein
MMSRSRAPTKAAAIALGLGIGTPSRLRKAPRSSLFAIPVPRRPFYQSLGLSEAAHAADVNEWRVCYCGPHVRPGEMPC